MTKEEARIIGSVIETADGGCPYCIADLVSMLNRKFTEYQWEVIDVEGETRVVVV